MFDELSGYTESLNSIEYYVTISSKVIKASSRVNTFHLMGINALYLLPEIFDDLSCALVLFHCGYFKQSKQVLRNTLELVVQFVYVDLLIQENRIADNGWVKKQKGVSRIFDMIKELEKTPFYKITILQLRKCIIC